MRKWTYIMLSMLVLLAVAMAQNRGERPTYVFPDLRFFPAMPVADDNPVTPAGMTLGRHLFYDPILSRDSSISCSSCHQQAAAFSDAPLAKSRGMDGALQQRNTPPLFNLAWYPHYFWDGRSGSLEAQALEPVRGHGEMDLDWAVAEERMRNHPQYPALFRTAFGDILIDSILIAKAIAQFERTLISNRAAIDLALRGGKQLEEDVIDGFFLANDQTKGNCLHCHPTDAQLLGTTGGLSNNGLPPLQGQEMDRGRAAVTGLATDEGKFRIPSLRNLKYTAPYMHDGRFATLEEVLEFYSSGVQAGPHVDPKLGGVHQGGNRLTAEENCKLLAFLGALDDAFFVRDTAFANPFARK
jgi:cytochrome c peroxidase